MSRFLLFEVKYERLCLTTLPNTEKRAYDKKWSIFEENQQQGLEKKMELLKNRELAF